MGKREGKLGVIIIKIGNKADVDQTVRISIVECHIEVELSLDKIIEKGHSMINIIEVISEEKIFEECKLQWSKF